MAMEKRKVKKKALEKAYTYIRRRSLTERKMREAGNPKRWWHLAATFENAVVILVASGMSRHNAFFAVNSLEFCNEERMTKENMLLNMAEIYEII